MTVHVVPCQILVWEQMTGGPMSWGGGGKGAYVVDSSQFGKKVSLSRVVYYHILFLLFIVIILLSIIYKYMRTIHCNVNGLHSGHIHWSYSLHTQDHFGHTCRPEVVYSQVIELSGTT